MIRTHADDLAIRRFNYISDRWPELKQAVHNLSDSDDSVSDQAFESLKKLIDDIHTTTGL